MKILVADDDALSRHLVQKTLERTGYQVVAAKNGQDAIDALLCTDGPRLALLDWIMPERDGPSICREVRAQTQFPYIYIVLLTSKESKEDIIAGLEAGADDFLSKPFDPEELKARLRSGQRILELQDKLIHEARHDHLTKVPNRALFLERIELVIRRAGRRSDYQFALLYLDIDRFKSVNDTLGHLAGDQLIRETAERLLQCIRRDDVLVEDGKSNLPAQGNDDTVARLGGDEFAILLDDIHNASDAIRVAERIRDRIAQPFMIKERAVSVSASIGIALSATGYSAAKDMLSDADAAMYRAKSQGRSQFVVCDPAMHAHAVNRLKLETDLRRAVEGEEFRLHYQPVVSLRDSRLVGFEALLRWERPDFGLLSPGAFLAAAEETNLILPIGIWVLQQACRQVKAWNQQLSRDRAFTVAVNLSPKQFGQATLLKDIERVLLSSGCSPESLKLEITEDVAARDSERTLSMLHELATLGVGVNLDDFGTGISSFGYLQTFPLNMLKIDRSFILAMGARGKDHQSARTILNLGHDLGVAVIAEGVETRDQACVLDSLGCDYAQGSFFSQPLDPMQVSRLLQSSIASGGRPSLPLMHSGARSTASGA